MADVTNYNKASMEELNADVGMQIRNVEDAKAQLATNFNIMKSNWVEGDADATAIIQNVESSHTKLDEKMVACLDLMNEFKRNVAGQVDSYSGAEAGVQKKVNEEVIVH